MKIKNIKYIKAGEYKDTEMADFASEMWAEGHSFFMYQSDSVDALASCCFDGSQNVIVRSSTTGPLLTRIKDLWDYKDEELKNLCVFHNGAWVPARRVKLPKRPLYKIITANNKEIIVTDNHLNPTIRGNIETTKLVTDDYLLFNTMSSDTIRNKEQNTNSDLTYEQGYLVGLYAGDGSIYKHKNCDSLEVTWSLNHKKNNKSTPILQKAINQLNIDYKLCENEGQNNVYFVKACNKQVAVFIKQFIHGETSETKFFDMSILDKSEAFRKGICDGFYDSDGGNSNRIYSSSKTLIDGLEAIFTTLGVQTIIDLSDRVGEYREIRGKAINVKQPLYCLRWYHDNNKREVKNIYKKINNSIYFKIKSIEQYESNDDYVYCFECKNKDEPYFTLPNGIITHNCRLRNAVEDNTFSYTLGAGGIETGSKCVITMNLNRIVQDWYKEKDTTHETLPDYIGKITDRIHCYLNGWNAKLTDDYNNGLLTVYKAGFISLDKQYLTVGVNGFVESAEFLGIKPDPDNEQYKKLAHDILGTIKQKNIEARTESFKIYRISIQDTNYAIPDNIFINCYKNNKLEQHKISEILNNSNYNLDSDDIKQFIIN
jgi:hypothetical protein